MSENSAIDALKIEFSPDQLHLHGTDHFNKLNGSYLSLLESDIKPAAVFQPKTAEDVCTFIHTIKSFVVSDKAVFAVRSAGQQPLPGCANIEGGITCDLSLLKGVDLDLDTGIVSIGAGERWGAVYDELCKHGLGITGSRSAKGGIGGLALTGGLSFFSTREGLICDNVDAYDVVIASGQIVKCSSDENPDLYKCLRGGGNNFGIVTRYHMRTFRQGPFWGGSLLYHPPSFPGQIEALVKHLKEEDAGVDNDTKETHLMISLFYAAQFGATLGLNQVYYTRDVEHPTVLEPFVSVQPQLEGLNSVGRINLAEAAREQASMAAEGLRVAYANTTVKADVATLQRAVELFNSRLEDVRECEGILFSLTFQPYPVSLLEKCGATGGNVTGLTPDDGPLVSVLVLMNWNDKQDDDIILAAAKNLLEAIDEDATTKGQAVPYKYMNYAASFQDPIRSYGDENKTFMLSVSKKYDPEGLFQNGVPGGFKLFP
ncbi:FAD-binding domain-containing protein [Astrocystis sublimbata]|nr:FAD-binding domain-containing protein [Astrocystis sublimbata]